MQRRQQMWWWAVAVATGAATGAGLVTFAQHGGMRPAWARDDGRTAVEAQAIGRAQDLSHAFQATARAIRPSVVSISSVKKLRVRDSRMGPRGQIPGVPEEFRKFFDDDALEHMWPKYPDRDLQQEGIGSGVIVSRDGYIVTNNHVVAGADEVTVTLHDKRDFKAKLVGTDRATDLAVLKIAATDLPVAELGNSDGVEVGDWVLACGSPMGLDQTVTAGIISAKGRQVGVTNGGYEDFLQTDAAINPGNSGGPLVNLQGDVIGINTAIASRNGGNMGIGFAIPAKMVRHVLDQLVSSGKVTRGRIGAAIQDLTEDLASSFGYSSRNGVLIGDVVAGSPAEKAGLKPGDIVVKYQGKPAVSVSQFRNAVAVTAPGTRADLEVFRDGKTVSLKIDIGELTDAELASTTGGDDQVQNESLGLTVQTLTPEMAKQIGARDGLKGVVVTDVEAGSVAARGGLAQGDVIVGVAGRDVTTLQDFRDVVKAETLSAGIRLRVVRDGQTRFVFLRALPR